MSKTKVRVQAIISFSDDGKMQPLYIAHRGESRKVLSSYVSHEDLAWITYECSIQIDDMVRSVTLLYSIREHAWDMVYQIA